MTIFANLFSSKYSGLSGPFKRIVHLYFFTLSHIRKKNKPRHTMFTFKFLNMSSDNRTIFVMNYESRTKCSNNICFFYYHNGWLTLMLFLQKYITMYCKTYIKYVFKAKCYIWNTY